MTDVLVIGGGPAGMAAAATAARHGADVTMIDEQTKPGGQVYRALPESFTVADDLGPDHMTGEALRTELAASGARLALGERVWNASPGFRIDTIAADGTRQHKARALIVATGTSERHVPFPGWTLPGVIGLAAATILLKSQRLLPGRRVVIAGAGPLLAVVARGIIRGGGDVVAVVDAASRREWLGKMPRLLARPDLLLRGAGWIVELRRRNVPWLSGHVVSAAHGDDRVTWVEIAPLDREGKPSAATQLLECDALTIGFGLVPNCDITRLLRADHVFRSERGGWIATRDDAMRTSVSGLYLAGDGAGISGAVAAELEGRLAALSALADLELLSTREATGLSATLRRQHHRAARFGGAMAELMAPRDALYRAIARDCTLCRCEDVPRAAIDAAIAAGATDVNQLKAWTRAGMGPCQGKTCGEAIATLLAAQAGSREDVGAFTVRPPLRPLPTGALIGEFDYADIPIPKPAPL
jgi:thioredoxin reductase/bacterioferritin-associated ferredoxin